MKRIFPSFDKGNDNLIKHAAAKEGVAVVSLAVAFVLLAALAGCEPRDKGEEVRAVDWYESHKTERAAKLAECMANPGKLDGTPNCVNASRAENNVQGATKWGTGSEDVRTAPAIPY